MNGCGELGALRARRISLIGLLLLLGVTGAALLGGAPWLSSAGAAECLTCEEGEEEPPLELEYPLTIQVDGTGMVKRDSTVYCENTGGGFKSCKKELPDGEEFTLTAAPGSGMAFIGWSGDCSGAGACEVTMDEAKSVTATFADKTPPLPPTITSPSSEQVFETSGSLSVQVQFNNSGDGSAVAFLCRVDVNSPTGASSCAPPAWNTPALEAGGHTVYVWAKDSVGNISSPASRSFKIVKTETPPTEEGGGGTGGSGGGGGSGSGGTPTSTPTTAPEKIDARLLARWRLVGAKTVFRRLGLRGLPAGATVTASCAGKGCPFKSRKLVVKGGAADAGSLVAKRKLRAGVVLSLKAAAPGMTGETFELKLRAHRPPKVTER